MKGVRGVGVDHKLRGFGRSAARGQGGFHFFHRVKRNASVFFSVQAQHRGAQVAGEVNRVLGLQIVGHAHQATVPGHARLHWPLGCIQPGNAPAPAKAGNGNF